MRDVVLCLGLIGVWLLCFHMFGYLAARRLGLTMNGIQQQFLGVFLFYGAFQLLALPLILLKKKLTLLMMLWMLVLAAAVLAYLFVRIREKELPRKGLLRKDGTLPFVMSPVKLLMLLVMAVQFYYVITSRYLGWDTSAYVGTIATSVTRNSMYQYVGESGKVATYIDLRYALSGFYMQSAVWCRLLGIQAIYLAKIVQGGILSILSGLVVYEMGCVMFSWGNSRSRREVSGLASAMVIVAAVIHVFFSSIYSASDFLLSRGLEAKAYCGNFVLPCIFLFGIMRWKEEDRRTTKFLLLAACWSSVAISMSCLVTAPALLILLSVPVLVKRCKKKEGRKELTYLVLCVLPNVIYLGLYAMHAFRIFRIEV